MIIWTEYLIKVDEVEIRSKLTDAISVSEGVIEKQSIMCSGSGSSRWKVETILNPSKAIGEAHLTVVDNVDMRPDCTKRAD